MNNQNYKIFNIIKNEFHNIINRNKKENISKIDSLYIIGKYKFGNFLICLNKAILFCEFFFCKRIIIQSNQNIFINNKIYYHKHNLTIEPNHNFTSNDNSLSLYLTFIYYKLNFSSLGNVNRFYIFREEILNNLPKVKVHPDDLLYI
jgi:hypothetical protein